jgi:hypothetical protein
MMIIGREGYMAREKGASARSSIVGFSVLVGAIGLSIADSVPGGMAGDTGFLLGVAAGLIGNSVIQALRYVLDLADHWIQAASQPDRIRYLPPR